MQSRAAFDHGVWWMWFDDIRRIGASGDRVLGRVFEAINGWHKEHQTLPESLDDLIRSNLLAGTPAHPFTGEPVRYFVSSPAPPNIDRFWVSVYYLGRERPWGTVTEDRPHHDAFRESGGTHLMLGDRRLILLIEPTVEND